MTYLIDCFFLCNRAWLCTNTLTLTVGLPLLIIATRWAWCGTTISTNRLPGITYFLNPTVAYRCIHIDRFRLITCCRHAWYSRPLSWTRREICTPHTGLNTHRTRTESISCRIVLVLVVDNRALKNVNTSWFRNAIKYIIDAGIIVGLLAEPSPQHLVVWNSPEDRSKVHYWCR